MQGLLDDEIGRQQSEIQIQERGIYRTRKYIIKRLRPIRTGDGWPHPFQ